MNDPSSSRYAIYFTPNPASALWQFGSGVIGYDTARGCDSEFEPAVRETGLTPLQRLEPARYGFHATLKPPFELADGAVCRDLLEAAQGFANRRRSIVLSGLAVTH